MFIFYALDHTHMHTVARAHTHTQFLSRARAHTHTHTQAHPPHQHQHTAVTYHSSWHVSLRNSRRTGRGNVVAHVTVGNFKGEFTGLRLREDSNICSVTRAAGVGCEVLY